MRSSDEAEAESVDPNSELNRLFDLNTVTAAATDRVKVKSRRKRNIIVWNIKAIEMKGGRRMRRIKSRKYRKKTVKSKSTQYHNDRYSVFWQIMKGSNLDSRERFISESRITHIIISIHHHLLLIEC
jgi:hypothetical protein